MNFIGHLHGSEVHLSDHCGTIEKRFTRKQTRKFKNRRWVKKYLKKYSYDFFVPGMVQIHDKIVMHPEVWEVIKKEAERQKQEERYMNHTLDSMRYAFVGNIL